MAVTRKDLSTYADQDAMKPENMTALVVALAQGPFLIEDVMTLMPSNDEFLFEKEVKNSKFKIAEKVGEKSVGANNTIEYEQNAVSTFELKEEFQITEKMVKPGNTFNFINIMMKGMESVASKIRLATEYYSIAEISDTSSYSSMNTVSAVAVWSSATTADPYADIVKGAEEINYNAQVEGNAVIIGSANHSEMTLADAVRDTKQYTIDYTEDGIPMARIGGIRVYKSTSQYDNSAGTRTPILTDKAIILNTAKAAILYESQPYTATRVFDERTGVIYVIAKRRLVPKVTDEKAITIVESI